MEAKRAAIERIRFFRPCKGGLKATERAGEGALQTILDAPDYRYVVRPRGFRALLRLLRGIDR